MCCMIAAPLRGEGFARDDVGVWASNSLSPGGGVLIHTARRAERSTNKARTVPAPPGLSGSPGGAGLVPAPPHWAGHNLLANVVRPLACPRRAVRLASAARPIPATAAV